MLYPRANKAKAHLTAGPGRNPKHKAPVKHYMQQRPIQHKASATMNKIKSAAKRHKVKNSVSYSSLIDAFETLILTLFQFVAKPSSKFTNPKNGGTVAAAANKAFTISMPISNHETGNFVNAQQNYFAAPQQLNNQGVIHGHSHVVVEPLTSLTQTTPTDLKTFAFFRVRGFSPFYDLFFNINRVLMPKSEGASLMRITLSEQIRQG